MIKKISLFTLVCLIVFSLTGCAILGGVKTPEQLKKYNFTTVEQLLEMENYPQYYFKAGPAKYLVTKEEWKIWKKINKTKDLALKLSTQKEFLRWFWQRRDPDSQTAQNEFKMAFYQNVVYAQQSFRWEYMGYGWKSDRGEIFLIFGPPDWESITGPGYFQYEIERKYAEKGQRFWSSGDETEEIMEWQYRVLEYLPGGAFYLSLNTPQSIYFRRGSFSGWQLAVYYDVYHVFLSANEGPGYRTSLEKAFDFLREKYVFDKNTKFSFPNSK